MSYRSLAARIARQERRRRGRRAFRPVMVVVHPNDTDLPPIGAIGPRGKCARLFDEPFTDFVSRASRETGQRVMAATYAEVASVDDDLEADDGLEIVTDESDPDRGGIGRIDGRYLGWHPANASLTERNEL